MLKVTNTFVLHVNGSCDVHGLRTTTVREVAMMYCKERYMENVAKDALLQSLHATGKKFSWFCYILSITEVSQICICMYINGDDTCMTQQ